MSETRIPTAKEVESALHALIAHRGYAVIGHRPGSYLYEIGEQTSYFAGYNLKEKWLKVVAKAKYSDWKAQCEWLGEHNPTWPKMIVIPTPGARYQKVKLAEGDL